MNHQRLLNVARALRESKNPDDFHMDEYVNSCGTPACAIGHYASRRDLQDAFTLSGPNFCNAGGGLAHYDSVYAQKHFDINYDECEELFGPEGCAGAETALEAAKYIENFVREHGDASPFTEEELYYGRAAYVGVHGDGGWESTDQVAWVRAARAAREAKYVSPAERLADQWRVYFRDSGDGTLVDIEHFASEAIRLGAKLP